MSAGLKDGHTVEIAVAVEARQGAEMTQARHAQNPASHRLPASPSA